MPPPLGFQQRSHLEELRVEVVDLAPVGGVTKSPGRKSFHC